MAYKKYIKRGGKIYGPYVYHSRRVDGKVVSEYMGPHRWKPDFKKIFLVFLGIFVLSMLVYFLVNFEGETTGRAVLNFDVNYSYLEEGLVEGILNLSLQEGDFIPATSKLIFENGGNISEFYLEDLVSESEIVEKTTYPLIYFNLIVESEEKIPEINEEKEIPEKEKEQEESEGEETEETGSNAAINETSTEFSNETVSDNESEEEAGEAEEKANETIEETESAATESSGASEKTEVTEGETEESITEETAEANENEITEQETENEAEEEDEAAEEVTENEAEESEPAEESSGAPITGGVIGANEGDQILISKIAKVISGFFLSLRTTGYATEGPVAVSGDVSFNHDFLYDLEKGQAVESIMIESGSVRTDSKDLSEEYIEIKTEESKIIVTTNYSESVEGFFGKDLIINMSALDMAFVQGELKVSIVEPDSGKEIFSFLTMVSEEGIEIKPEMIFLPEVIELTEPEREILVKEFGENVTVDVSEAMEKNNLLVVKYRIANYEMIRSYELSLSKEIIESFMERDRIKFLKDIAMTLSRQEEPGKTRDDFLGEWSVQE